MGKYRLDKEERESFLEKSKMPQSNLRSKLKRKSALPEDSESPSIPTNISC